MGEAADGSSCSWLQILDSGQRSDRARYSPADGAGVRELGRIARGHAREIDVGPGDHVDVVRPGVEGDVEHNLDYLGIVVPGGSDGAKIFFADVAPFAHDLDGKANGNVRLWVGRGAVAVGSHLGIVQSG